MKAQTNNQQKTTSSLLRVAGQTDIEHKSGESRVSSPIPTDSSSRLRIASVLTKEAISAIINDEIPDLTVLCVRLYQRFLTRPGSVLSGVDVIQALDLTSERLNTALRSQPGSHVLVDNPIMKVVLIHWTPGKVSSIHGHPSGGCVFKVLNGSLEELRYTTDESPALLAASTYHKGGMGYIDDRLGYHAVGNPFNSPAISLHVYTR